MARRKSATNRTYGDYVWRGANRIAVEKLDDRFTIVPATSDQLERARSLPGVRRLKRVTKHVFKVETTMNERDGAMAALRSPAYKTVAHHAYKPLNSEGTVYYITDQIILSFKRGTKASRIEAVLNKFGLKLLKEFEQAEKTFLVQVTATSGENPIKIANRLYEESDVLSAEPNMINRLKPAFTPNDTLFPKQWHLSAKPGPQLVREASINAPEAWNITRGERTVVVAVMDDGFDLKHPDFQGANKIVFPRDFVDGDSNPAPVKSAGDYHGTPCAGVAIAESNGRGVVGAAHGCSFMPVRFPLNVKDDVLADIFQEVGAHADVISCSWGPPPVYSPLPMILYQTIKKLAQKGGPEKKGCIICFAAGNYNAPVQANQNGTGFEWLDDTDEIQVTKGRIQNGFAVHPNVIAVAASTSLNRHAAYSNWGSKISVCAPSDNFHPLNRNEFVPGRGIWTTDNEAVGDGFTSNSKYTGAFGGTSSATPLVAGVAALVRSANPKLTATQIKQILQSTADKIVDLSIDLILETNRGRYNRRGHSEWFGFGKVNAAAALKEAVRRRKQT